MARPQPLDLATDPPRYLLVVAACWIAGCGVIAGAAGSGVRTELLFLPAILALAFYHGLTYGLLAAVASAGVASAAEVAMDGMGPGAAVVAWNFVARSLMLALPACLTPMLRGHPRSPARLPTKDPVTGFMTRQGLLTLLADELVGAAQAGGETSIVCIGLDGPARSREQAATRLQDFCDALRTCARRSDLLARLGDDEFAVLLRGAGSQVAEDTAWKLAQSLTGWLLTRGNDVSCAVGHSTAPRGRLVDAAAVIAQARAHMQACRQARGGAAAALTRRLQRPVAGSPQALQPGFLRSRKE